MLSFWLALNEAQAIILGSVVTVLGTLLAVGLGSFFFSGKVKSIEDAIERSEKVVEAHLATLTTTLGAIAEKTSQLDEMLAALSPKVAELSAGFADQEQEAVQQDGLHEPAVGPAPQEGENGDTFRSEVRTLWFGVRDRIERMASAAHIDGRTRAKYMRIDRRSYPELIAVMRTDGNLGAPAAEAANQVFTAWARYRRAQFDPTANEMARLREAAQVVNTAT